MPFKSKSQQRKCMAMKSKNWDCDAWMKETPGYKNLPEHVKKNSKKKGK